MSLNDFSAECQMNKSRADGVDGMLHCFVACSQGASLSKSLPVAKVTELRFVGLLCLEMVGYNGLFLHPKRWVLKEKINSKL